MRLPSGGEHAFATSQGYASRRLVAAREMGWVSLIHALSLVVLYARVESPKFEPAAVRWLTRLALEGRGVGLHEAQLAAGALACFGGSRHERAAKTSFSLL